jgi:O-acetyl-ADP-ribose deacetylase (regulator of RNase III)|eukprot:g45.t1
MSDVIDSETLVRFFNDQDAVAEQIKKGASGPIRLDLSNKLSICSGDIVNMKCDGIACPFNVRMRPAIPVSTALLSKAGFHTQDALRRLKSQERCHHSGRFHTSQTLAVDGGNLHCKTLITCVTPTYSNKYESAAVNALDKIIVNILTSAVESKCRSVAFCGLFNTIVADGYDHSIAVHVAMKSLRKFLEKYSGKFDHVVFFALDCEELALFQSAAPVYFPRTSAELDESKLVRNSLTSVYKTKRANTFAPERAVRVSAMPGANDGGASRADKTEKALSRFKSMSYSPLYDATESRTRAQATVREHVPKLPQKTLFVRRFNVLNVTFGKPMTVPKKLSHTSSKYTAYEINVMSETKPLFTMYRRFSEFYDVFSNVLETAYAESDKGILKALKNVEFPSRVIFWGSSMDEEVVKERLEKLQIVMSRMISVENASIPVIKMIEHFLHVTTPTDEDAMRTLRFGNGATPYGYSKNNQGVHSAKENQNSQNSTNSAPAKVNKVENVAKPKTGRSFRDNVPSDSSGAEKAKRQTRKSNGPMAARVRIFNDFDTARGEGNRFITNESL